jgi:hypothetical protein
MVDYDVYTNSYRTLDGRLGIANHAQHAMWAQGLSDIHTLVECIYQGLTQDKKESGAVIKSKYAKMIETREKQQPDQILESGLTGTQKGGSIPIFNFNPARAEKEKRRARSVTPRVTRVTH